MNQNWSSGVSAWHSRYLGKKGLRCRGCPPYRIFISSPIVTTLRCPGMCPDSARCLWKEGEKIAPCWEPLVKMTCFPWLEGWTLDPDPPSLEFHSCWVKQSIHVWCWLIKNAVSWRDCFGPLSCSLDVQDALTPGFLRTLSFLPVFLLFCESSYMLQYISSLLKLTWISFWWKTLND